MSIKSTNIDFTILSNPPVGYTFIGTDLDGILKLKYADGTIVIPTGVGELSELLDVSISGQTIGEALVWDGSKWINSDVIPDLTNYFTKAESDSRYTQTGVTSTLSSNLSTETSDRISADTSLQTAINNVPVFNDVPLWTSLSGESSIRLSQDNVLSTSISTETSERILSDSSLGTLITTETSERISGDASLLTIISNIPVFNPSGLTASISTETSNRIEGDSSLQTLISNESSVRISQDNVLSTSIITETSNRTSADESLLTIISNIPVFNPSGLTASISTETSERIVADSSLSTKIDNEISDRIVADESLLTIISNIPVFNPSGLTASISTETSERILADESLLTIISNIPVFDDTDLWTSISGESSTRLSQDNILSSSITTETSERILADESLLTIISNIPTGTTYNDTNIWTSISGETSTRLSEDLILSTAISTETSDRTTADNSIMTVISTLISTDDTKVDKRSPSDNHWININDSQIIISGKTGTEETFFQETGDSIRMGYSNSVGPKYNYLGLGVNGVHSNKKFEYLDDYSSTFTDRSLIDKGYLYTQISGLTSGSTYYNDTNLWTSLSGESSSRISSDSVLSSSISTETSERISGDESLQTIINNIPEFDDTNLWTSISGESSTRLSEDLILSTSISNEISDRISGDESLVSSLSGYSLTGHTHSQYVLSSELSTETSERISGDASLLTIISNIPTGSTFDPTNIWTAVSGETSTRLSEDSILSTSISNETSERILADLSLSTALENAIISGGTGSSTLSDLTDVELSSITDKNVLVYSGGTSKWKNQPVVNITQNIQDGDLIYLSGLTLSGTTYPYIQTTTSGANYTIQNSDNGKVLQYTETCTITLPNGLKNGFQASIVNMGSSKIITITAETTLYSKGNKNTIINQYSASSIIHLGNDVWLLVGDLA